MQRLPPLPHAKLAVLPLLRLAVMRAMRPTWVDEPARDERGGRALGASCVTNRAAVERAERSLGHREIAAAARRPGRALPAALASMRRDARDVTRAGRRCSVVHACAAGRS